jgi:nucleoside-diphosphate-sugar epimerase
MSRGNEKNTNYRSCRSFRGAKHETKHAWSTWDKSVRLLYFKHNTDLEEGLKKMWEWAKKQPNRKRLFCLKYEWIKGIYE